MTPAMAIAALDRALGIAGENITLRRTTGTALIPLDVACRAVVRGYQPHQLVGTIIQGDSQVILSPSEMKRRQWTWPPRKNDKAVIAGKVRNIEAAAPIYMGGELVRIELQVRG
jgi:hypothetical protein